MADPHIAAQAQHMPGVENIANQTIVLAQVQLAPFAGHDAGGILATVLEYGQCVVNQLIY
jgi:hypothetical protein